MKELYVFRIQYKIGKEKTNEFYGISEHDDSTPTLKDRLSVCESILKEVIEIKDLKIKDIQKIVEKSILEDLEIKTLNLIKSNKDNKSYNNMFYEPNTFYFNF